MATNKPSLKEKLYQETLDEISRKTNLPPDKSENWQDVKDKVGVEDYKGFAVFSIYEMEKAVKLTIDKTEVEARIDTAKQIFAELEKHNTGYGDIILSKEELLELKKKYKAD